MSFQIGLSGMRAASKDLNVTGNNIANAGTVGFKRSRAEFADVYAATVLGTGKTQNGSGVLLADVSQLFQQGIINPTENPLDLAINGNGFFQVSNNGAHSYTRAGFFGLDREGYIVDNYNYNLQGYTVNANGDLEVGKVGNLRIETNMADPKATSKINQNWNLNSTLEPPASWQSAYDRVLSTAYNDAYDSVFSGPTGQAAYDDRLAEIGDAVRNAYLEDKGQEAYDVNIATAADPANPTAAEIAAADAARAAAIADPGNIADADAAKAAAELLPENIAQAVAAKVQAAKDAGNAERNDPVTIEDALSEAVTAVKGTFSATDPTTYTSATSTVIYDDQGNQHTMTQYFVKTGANTWDMHVLINGTKQTDNPVELEFDASGKMIRPASNSITISNWTPGTPDPNNPGVSIPNGAGGHNGQIPATIELDITNSSQYASPFAVTKVVQDGYSIGELSGVEIDDTGKIFARYTNNQSRIQGQVVLANFANVQGLQPVGKTQWVQTQESGPVVLNPGTVGNNGAIQAGALEESNVELSDQLIQLIVAQRNYQANAKTIETQSAITQTIINMR